MKVTFNRHMSTMDGSFKRGESYDLPEAYVKPWLDQGILTLDEPADEPEPEVTPEPEQPEQPEQPKRRGRKPKVAEQPVDTVAEDESPL